MARRRPSEPAGGRFTVGDRSAPSVGSALSLAVTVATREERTQYVRDFNGDTVATVERHEDRSLTIRVKEGYTT